MCKVVDPLGGSYYIEIADPALVDEAWAIIEKVQAEGGMARPSPPAGPRR
jgi:methylmalonyl-CoA mutase